MKRKFRFTMIMMMLLSMVLAACSSSGSSTQSGGEGKDGENVIRIGTILPLTGDAAPLGQLGKEARDMAIEEINANGGIESLGGAKIELVYGDSQGKPEVGVSEAERLITQENVVMLNGSYQSGVTLPASAVAQKYKKVWFAPVPSDPSITERDYDYVFRMADTSGMRAASQIQFMKNMEEMSGTDLKTAAIVYENTAWGQGVAKEWQKQLPEAGFEIVVDEPYDKSSPDLTPVVTKVKDANPDVVLLVSYVSDATLLANGFKEQKVQPKLFLATSGGYADPEYIRNAGENTLGFFDVSAWESDVSRPFSEETNNKFIEKYDHAMNGEAVKAYTGMYVIKDVLERAASTDSEKIREAFAATDITEGPTQMYTKHIHFDETGTLPDPALVIIQFKEIDGKIERVTVWPEDVARKDANGKPYPIDFPYGQ
jgi:branched-chain amino acid transport system substrate-binding protein